MALWDNTEKNIPLLSCTQTAAYPEQTKPTAIDFDKHTYQSSFEFETTPNIIFVENMSSLKPIDFYEDLPKIQITSEEKTICQAVVKEQQKINPRFYDGQRMVIANISYDPRLNTIYIEAKKAPYSFIVALSQKRFSMNSQLYQHALFKSGVLAPLVSKNGETILLQRSTHGLFSVPAGFLEPQGKDKQLNFEGDSNIVNLSAYTEIKEEVAGISGQDALRFEYSMPQISAISFRSTDNNPLGTIEFIAPSYAACSTDELIKQAFEHNNAEDSHEHTDKHIIIPLALSRHEDIPLILSNSSIKIPGAALYLPVILSLFRLYNQKSNQVILKLRYLLNSKSTGLPINTF
jgi:hypothetical protein